METWVYLICALVILTAVFLYVHGRRARVMLAHLPTYPYVPVFGNLFQFIGGGESIFKCLSEMSKLSEETNLPFAFWIGPSANIVVSDPQDVKTVSNAFADKPYYYNFAKLWLENGLVTAPASVWKMNIKKLGGTFTQSVVDGYQAVFDAQAQRLVQRLKMAAGGAPFDVMYDLAYTTLEAICQTALGVPRISESIITVEYYDCFNRTLALFLKRGLNLAFHLDWVYRLSASYRELKKCVAVLHNVSKTVIKTRKKEIENIPHNNKEHQNEEDLEPKFKAYYDILMAMRQTDPTLTEAQIQAEVDTIILAGQETVATALFYTILMVGCWPEVQAKLYAELHEIFGNTDRPVLKEDLVRMRYCEAVVLETLRMYPPVPGIMRYADKDLKIKSCIIPKGTGCVLNIWGAGRSQQQWGADADVYRPERWLEGAADPGAAFLPFSYGKRSCIGKRYAISILKTSLARCVRALIIQSDAQNLRLKVDIALRPISGHYVTVKLRDNANTHAHING